MNKAFIGVAIALAGIVTGCNNSGGVFPVGIPSIVLAAPDSKSNFVKGTPGTPATPTAPATPGTPDKWVLTGKLEVRALRGSVAGTVISFKSNGSDLFGGPFVEACAVTAEKECGPYVSNYTLEYTSVPGSVDITSVVVQGLNGIKYEVQLSAPIPLGGSS